MEDVPYITVLVTTQDQNEARAISHAVLNEKLAACVNIIKDIESFFWWEGKIDRAEECLLIMKTRKELFRPLEAVVKKNHSYSVPEIIALPVVAGQEDYLSWIKDTVQA